MLHALRLFWAEEYVKRSYADVDEAGWCAAPTYKPATVSVNRGLLTELKKLSENKSDWGHAGRLSRKPPVVVWSRLSPPVVLSPPARCRRGTCTKAVRPSAG